MKTKVVTLLILSILVSCLASCVEGRAGKKGLGLNSNQLKDNALGSSQEQVNLAYINENFNEILMNLQDLFNKSFLIPTHITDESKILCPIQITTQNNYDLYSAYIEELVATKLKYDDALDKISDKINKEQSLSNRTILMDAHNQLKNEKTIVLMRITECTSSVSSYQGSGQNGSGNSSGSTSGGSTSGGSTSGSNSGGSGGGDCATESSKNIAALNKIQLLMNQHQVSVLIDEANYIFGEPVPTGGYRIDFENYSHLYSNVACASYINYSSCTEAGLNGRMLVINAYAKEILDKLIPVFNLALTTNSSALNDPNQCIKEIAQKVKNNIDSYKIITSNQSTVCKAVLNSLPCPLQED